MNRRIVWSIAGVVLIVAGFWLTTRLRGSPMPGTTPAPSVARDAAAAATSASPTAIPAARPDGERDGPTEVAGARSPSTAASAVLPADPIDIAPGFEGKFPRSETISDTDFRWPLVRQHEKLQAEPRDPAWSERTETALRQGIEHELTAKGFDTQRIQLPVIECRTTGCEIQAIGFQADNSKPDVDLQMILPRVLTGPLSGEFDRDAYSMSLSDTPDGRIAIIGMLPRKKP